MTRNLLRIIPMAFAISMVAIGIADLTRPDSFRAAMDQINMPHYILWILGFAKVLGGSTILFVPIPLLKEWAFAGFFIWAIGGLAAHGFSGHGIREMTPILALSVFLIFAYFTYRKNKRI